MASELQRFIITKPVEGGTQWFDVCDTQDSSMQNRPLASFAADLASHYVRENPATFKGSD